VRLHHITTIEAGASTRAAGKRLVVLIARIAEGEIVHRAVARGHHAERADERIGNALRSFHIACDCRRGRFG
jgi:hypothetical protein